MHSCVCVCCRLTERARAHDQKGEKERNERGTGEGKSERGREGGRGREEKRERGGERKRDIGGDRGKGGRKIYIRTIMLSGFGSL